MDRAAWWPPAPALSGALLICLVGFRTQAPTDTWTLAKPVAQVTSLEAAAAVQKLIRVSFWMGTINGRETVSMIEVGP